MSSSPPPDDVSAALVRRPWWRPQTLTARLIVMTIALVAVVSLLVAAVTTLALRQFLFQRLDDQLMQNADFAGRAYTAPGGFLDVCTPTTDFPRVPGALGSLTGSLDEGCRRAIVLRNSATPLELSDANLVEIENADSDGRPNTVDLDGIGEYRVVVLERGGHTIVTGLPTDDVTTTIGRMMGWEALVALLGVAVAAAGALYLVRRELRPLRRVAATAQQVTQLPLGAGAVGLTARVPNELTNPETEVGQVGSAVNRMLSHVEAALDARHESELQVRQFVADASHELRTPLSTIQGYAELTRRADASDEATLRHAMSKVETESARMATLVDDLLLLARLDSGRPLARDEVDLTLLVVETVNDARVVDSERRWKLSLPHAPVFVVGDAHRLHQVLTNLLSNARRHTSPGTTVTVEAHLVDGGSRVQLTIHDNGAGMPVELKGREFERFTRGDSSRTRASGGAGLGLSIVQAIVSAHGGSVAVASVPGDTRILITLPCLPLPTQDHSSATA